MPLTAAVGIGVGVRLGGEDVGVVPIVGNVKGTDRVAVAAG